ncbi:futalosine hydrolase [Paenibacillus methanolicus]|uniref:Futalosine hydrolase n=1 Tax=Paenibacillus methanolicus TaxID=582686 RepID=A0A5S5CIK0_9BACL|nr:futalosine hydrolase [Paenibacillus methanolicus]TYP79542.1 futalosine hydrolase [Paenibacillus methanolicus]
MENVQRAEEARCLIVTSVEAELEAVKRGLGGSERFHILVGGVGQAAAAASTAAALALGRYERVITMGIGGGFQGAADIGTVVVASEIVAADLGAESADGFMLIDELGFGSARMTVDESMSRRIAAALTARGIVAAYAPVLTVSTVTGTADTAAALVARIPGAAAEAMEGYGVAAAAKLMKVPVLEIRGISNAVGPRDRDAWRIKDALQALEAAGAALTGVI